MQVLQLARRTGCAAWLAAPRLPRLRAHLPLAPQVQGMTKEYKTRSGRPFLAVNNVSLDVPANSITALLGPSGSGGLWFSPNGET